MEVLMKKGIRICCIVIALIVLLLVGWRISMKIYISTITNQPEKVFEYEDNSDGTITLTDVKWFTVIGSFALENDCFELTIPEEIDGKTVTAISHIFLNKKMITSIELPDSVTSLGDSCFWGFENLTSINLENVSNIGERCFQYCEKLTSINLESIRSIGNGAFSYCYSLEEVKFPPSVEEIGVSIFHCCNLDGYIVLPDGLTKIDNAFFASAFSGVWTEIWIPNTVATIDEDAFRYADNFVRIHAPQGSYAANWLKEHYQEGKWAFEIY